MARIHVPDAIPLRNLERSRSATLVFGAMFVVGLLSFIARLVQDAPSAWASYVSNWMFFTSIAMGALILVVAATITSARWNWSVKRVSISFVAFLPIAFILFLPMLGLREEYFHWIGEMATDPILQKKQAWLNVPFLLTRNVIGVLVLFGLSVYFAYLYVRPDLGLAADSGDDDPARARWRERLMNGWLGQESEEVASHQRLARLAPGMVLVYAAVMSMLAYDWAMSLEPHWYSTLFGVWFFMGAFWGGVAATAVATVWLRTKHADFAEAMGSQQRHDLGKLAFAFCVFWTYLFWSQYLVIWYGKLPWEQAWMVHRAEAPWGALSALVILLCFVVPFAGLIGRQPKLRPPFLATFCSVILVGLWLEMYVWIAPPLHEAGPPITIFHPLIALLFLGPFLWALRWAWSTFPVIQVWQPLVESEMLEAERQMEVEAGAAAD